MVLYSFAWQSVPGHWLGLRRLLSAAHQARQAVLFAIPRRAAGVFFFLHICEYTPENHLTMYFIVQVYL